MITGETVKQNNFKMVLQLLAKLDEGIYPARWLDPEWKRNPKRNPSFGPLRGGEAIWALPKDRLFSIRSDYHESNVGAGSSYHLRLFSSVENMNQGQETWSVEFYTNYDSDDKHPLLELSKKLKHDVEQGRYKNIDTTALESVVDSL